MRSACVALLVSLVFVFAGVSCRCVREGGEPLSDEEIAARFASHVDVFERLRDEILVERKCSEVWSDRLEWEEPCRDDPTKTCALSREGAPTAEDLARVCDMGEGRAQSYLDDLGAISAMEVSRARPDPRPPALQDHAADDVEILLEVYGIIPSGGDVCVVFRTRPPGNMDEENETGTHGTKYVALPKPGWYVRREWN